MKAFFVTLLALPVLLVSPAMAGTFTLCPTDANQNGAGSFSFSAPQTETGVCSQSVTMNITNATDYARFAWDSSSAGYPTGVTLGELEDMNASLVQTGANDPYYMLAGPYGRIRADGGQ